MEHWRNWNYAFNCNLNFFNTKKLKLKCRIGIMSHSNTDPIFRAMLTSYPQIKYPLKREYPSRLQEALTSFSSVLFPNRNREDVWICAKTNESLQDCALIMSNYCLVVFLLTLKTHLTELNISNSTQDSYATCVYSAFTCFLKQSQPGDASLESGGGGILTF